MSIAIDALLALAVLIAWIITAAFMRWRSGYDRLHAITFFNLIAGGAITAAAVIHDGVTARTFQCVLIWLVMASAGALLSHAIARALRLRGEGQG
ncbi:MAG TPA: monovalent cation/H(+) antiporter subunit G [Rhodanobacteraceae bacterium]|nr:monovalent cation/H(+) antiporter subunit G [Rhodanobacteraceae bacterium]